MPFDWIPWTLSAPTRLIGSWEFTAALNRAMYSTGIPRTHMKFIWEEHHAEPSAIVNVKGPGTQIGQMLNLHHVLFLFSFCSVPNLTSIRTCILMRFPLLEWSSRLRLVITGDKRPAALCICLVWLKMRLQVDEYRFRDNFVSWASLYAVCRNSLSSFHPNPWLKCQVVLSVFGLLLRPRRVLRGRSYAWQNMGF